MLIVGCGCRGRALAGALAEAGQVVRGTTRDEARVPELEAAGVEGVVADPDRVGTLLRRLEGVSAVCWLMGSANGGPEAVAALHGPRLSSLLEALVDTPVRGFVYEGAGTAPREHLEEGARIVRAAGETFRLPVAVVAEDATDHDRWLAAMSAACGRVLGARTA